MCHPTAAGLFPVESLIYAQPPVSLCFFLMGTLRKVLVVLTLDV